MSTRSGMEVLGAITRYTLAVVALISLAQFLLLIGVGTEKAQELAGETGGRAVLCGVVAAVWFYRHRRRQQLNLAIEKLPKASGSPVAPQAGAPSLSQESPKVALPSLAEPPQPEAAPPPKEANVPATEARNTGAPDVSGADRVRTNGQHVPEIVAEPDGANTVKIIAILAGLVLVLLFGWFVWPTQYRYDTLGTARIPIRTNRFTGDTERLTLQGWITPAPPVDNPFDQIFGRDAAPRGAPATTAPSGADPGNEWLNKIAKEPQHQPGSDPLVQGQKKLAPNPTNPADEVLAATDTVSNCPSELPAGNKAMGFSPDEVKQVIGTKAHLGLKDGYWVEWVMLHFSNGSKHCITLVEVELTLQYGNSSFKQRHTVSFNPILGPGQESGTSIELNEQGPEKNGEPLSLQEWHVTMAWGFNYATPQFRLNLKTPLSTPEPQRAISKGADNKTPAPAVKGPINVAHEPWVTDELTGFDFQTGHLKTASGLTVVVYGAEERAMVLDWRYRAVKPDYAGYNSIYIRVMCVTQSDCLIHNLDNKQDVHARVLQ